MNVKQVLVLAIITLWAIGVASWMHVAWVRWAT